LDHYQKRFACLRIVLLQQTQKRDRVVNMLLIFRSKDQWFPLLAIALGTLVTYFVIMLVGGEESEDGGGGGGQTQMTPQQFLQALATNMDQISGGLDQLAEARQHMPAKKFVQECKQLEEMLMQYQLAVDSIQDDTLREQKKQVTTQIQSVLRDLDSIINS
jgi:hypothetical protein